MIAMYAFTLLQCRRPPPPPAPMSSAKGHLGRDAVLHWGPGGGGVDMQAVPVGTGGCTGRGMGDEGCANSGCFISQMRNK